MLNLFRKLFGISTKMKCDHDYKYLKANFRPSKWHSVKNIPAGLTLDQIDQILIERETQYLNISIECQTCSKVEEYKIPFYMEEVTIHEYPTLDEMKKQLNPHRNNLQ